MGTSMRHPAGGLQKIQFLTSPPAGDLGGKIRLLQSPQLSTFYSYSYSFLSDFIGKLIVDNCNNDN